MKYLGSFGGPSAPWIDDSDSWDEEQDLASIVGQIGQSLARSLEYRATTLREKPTFDLVVQEIRAQIAAAAVTGQLSAVAELSDLMVYLQSSLRIEQQQQEKPEEIEQGKSSLLSWDDKDE